MITNRKVLEIDNAIEQLIEHTDETSIKPLITALQAYRKDMSSEGLLRELTATWRKLGVYQGTVLTYVPYFYTLIPDDIFGDDLEELD